MSRAELSLGPTWKMKRPLLSHVSSITLGHLVLALPIAAFVACDELSAREVPVPNPAA